MLREEIENRVIAILDGILRGPFAPLARAEMSEWKVASNVAKFDKTSLLSLSLL